MSKVAEVAPRRVLEVGCGTGEFAKRVANELGAEVVAVEISARMVGLTAARGIDARVADVRGGDRTSDLSYWSENGEERLRLAFSSVQRRDAEGTLVFADSKTLREYIAATVTRAHVVIVAEK